MNTQSDPIRSASEKLANGLFNDALEEALAAIPSRLSDLQRGSAHYVIGCSLNELGRTQEALPHFLESVTAMPTNEPMLIAHVQDEIARIQLGNGFLGPAMFFIDMAIANFELSGSVEMKEKSQLVKEEILKKQ